MKDASSWAYQGEDGFTKATAETYEDKADARDAIRDGQLPAALPEKVGYITVTTEGKRVFASWEGKRAEDPSCKVDPSAKLPDVPYIVRHDVEPTGDIYSCDDGHHTSAGGYTYFWTPAS